MIGVLDIGMGNINSLINAIYTQGFDYKIVSNKDEFEDISHLIIPGVGSYSQAVSNINLKLLKEPILAHVKKGLPLAGICLGMQLLSTSGSEGGSSLGLNLIEGEVILIQSQQSMRLPHVGWNNIQLLKDHPVLKGIKNDVDFYYVHSYRFKEQNIKNLIATTEYGETFPAIIAQDNVIGFQFHPEKSQTNGLKLIENFCLWNGRC